MGRRKRGIDSEGAPRPGRRQSPQGAGLEIQRGGQRLGGGYGRPERVTETQNERGGEKTQREREKHRQRPTSRKGQRSRESGAEKRHGKVSLKTGDSQEPDRGYKEGRPFAVTHTDGPGTVARARGPMTRLSHPSASSQPLASQPHC